MIDIKCMVNKVVKIKNKDGDRLAARLLEIVDEKYLKLRFVEGNEAYLLIDDIVFISPTINQPAVVV